jgi:ABC-type polysaccharide/polyol phosphate export permease
MSTAAWIILWWLVTALLVGLLFGAIARSGKLGGDDERDG